MTAHDKAVAALNSAIAESGRAGYARATGGMSRDMDRHLDNAERAAEVVLAALDALRWRNVREEPPEEKEETLLVRVALWAGGHEIGFGEYMSRQWSTDFGKVNVTHWRPLGPGPGVEGNQGKDTGTDDED